MSVSDHDLTARGKVFLVEDDPMIRALTAEWIEDAGYVVADFASGNEALEALASGGEAHAAVLDLTLPDMRGDELAERLRALQPNLALVYATGDSNDLSDGALDRPHTGLLHKPYSAADLQSAIEKVAGA
ncbi:response regulator [Aureimonas sp. ME7]|uniref:response regulator n=1 Tax=Aureimonas sp. ME7 TaxID=2744252 RepID=UPI0015F53C56|nr:response regulator [Aureimonas sp. ME7]